MNETAVQFGGPLYQTLEAAARLPGVRIHRSEFLKRTLSKHFPKHVVDLAIESNPAKAGIPAGKLDRIARSSINYETSKVTGISSLAGLPGKFAMVATVPADLAQYFAHVLRIMQKLMYLYGWDEIFDSDAGIDDETMGIITLFLGVMFGVQAANVAIMKIAANAALRTQKVLLAKTLTKGVLYPVVKRVAAVLGTRMTKAIFAKATSQAIPLLGALTSGGLTLITFRPLAARLQKHLSSLPTANVSFYKQASFVDGELDPSQTIDIPESAYRFEDEGQPPSRQ